jgi:hypothetical protein
MVGCLRQNWRLPRRWLDRHVAPAGAAYLRPALWHSLSHSPEISPRLRRELPIELSNGQQVLSLIDVMPHDYEQLRSVPTRAEYLAIVRKLADAQSVREYDETADRM